MTLPEKRQREEAVPPQASAQTQRAGARGRASSLPVALPYPPQPRPDGNPASPVLERLAATFAIPSDLLNARPSSLAGAHAAHAEAAGHWNGALPRHLRHAWGWLHLVIKAVTHAVDWIFGSPARFIVAALIAAAAWYWL